MRNRLSLLLMTLFFLSACSNHKGSGTNDNPPAGKANLYVDGLVPDPLTPTINTMFSVTVHLTNEGDASSGEYDVFVSLYRKGDMSATLGTEKIHMPNLGAGQKVEIPTGKNYFFKEEGEYEFIINASTADGTTTEKHWMVHPVK